MARGHGGEWLPLVAAAECLGVSIDTVRRRVRDGTLEARKQPSRRGPAWRVWLAPELLASHQVTPRGGVGDAREVGAMVAALQERVVALAMEAGRLQAQLEAAEGLTGEDGHQSRGRGASVGPR